MSEVASSSGSEKGKGRKRKRDQHEPDTKDDKRKRNPGGEGGLFTFMLPAVSRTLWYMLQEQGKTISTEVDKSFYQTWFMNIVDASTKIYRIKDGKNGCDVLFENIGEKWDYATVPPPQHVYRSLRGIKSRQVEKASPLPPIKFCSPLHAAWPKFCDAASGFEYDASFRVVWPTDKQQNVLQDDTCPEIEGIVSDASVCTSCWQCSCGGCKNLAWRSARQDTSIQDLKKEKEEALLLCGYQAQLVKEHWSQTASETVKACTKYKKEAATLQQQVEKQTIMIEKLEAEIDEYKRSSLHVQEALASKQQLQQELSVLQGKDEALTLALHKISTMSEICRACRSCMRKCGGYGINLEQ